MADLSRKFAAATQPFRSSDQISHLFSLGRHFKFHFLFWTFATILNNLYLPKLVLKWHRIFRGNICLNACPFGFFHASTRICISKPCTILTYTFAKLHTCFSPCMIDSVMINFPEDVTISCNMTYVKHSGLTLNPIKFCSSIAARNPLLQKTFEYKHPWPDFSVWKTFAHCP